MNAYWGNGFVDYDFHIAHCMNSTEAKQWNRAEDIVAMSNGEKQLLHCSYDYKMSEGLLLPLRGVSQLSRGGIGLAADITDKTEWQKFLKDRQSYFETICQTFHEFVLSKGYFNVFDLSPREKEVLKLIVCGMDKHDIADKLHISSRTSEVHIYRIRQKLKCINDAQVTAKALVYNLV
jgi:DNA-binding CsgD family transcriptional regulator